MVSVEQLLLKVAATVSKQVATTWLRERGKAERRGVDLAKLIDHRFPALRHQRQFKRKVEEIEDQIVERLVPLCDLEFQDLDENERVAALIEVTESIARADLSDRVLLDSDLEPLKLALSIRNQMVGLHRSAALSESGETFYRLVLDQTCYCVAYLVLELPEFNARAATETLARLSTLAAQVELVLNRLPSATPQDALTTNGTTRSGPTTWTRSPKPTTASTCSGSPRSTTNPG